MYKLLILLSSLGLASCAPQEYNLSKTFTLYDEGGTTKITSTYKGPSNDMTYYKVNTASALYTWLKELNNSPVGDNTTPVGHVNSATKTTNGDTASTTITYQYNSTKKLTEQRFIEKEAEDIGMLIRQLEESK